MQLSIVFKPKIQEKGDILLIESRHTKNNKSEIQSIKWTSKITRRRDFHLDWEKNRGYENEDGVDCRNQRYRKADFGLTVPHFEKGYIIVKKGKKVYQKIVIE